MTSAQLISHGLYGVAGRLLLRSYPNPDHICPALPPAAAAGGIPHLAECGHLLQLPSLDGLAAVVLDCKISRSFLVDVYGPDIPIYGKEIYPRFRLEASGVMCVGGSMTTGSQGLAK